MNNKLEHIGQTINGLKLLDIYIKEYPSGKKYQAIFTCLCGKTGECSYSMFIRGKRKSCGCIKPKRIIHNEAYSLEYKTLDAIKQRCLNKNSSSFENYGGRGIRICKRWLEKGTGILNFIEDMGRKPGKEYSIDRIDVNKGYYKDNCRWVTNKEQQNNKRNNNIIEFEGKRMTLTQWSEYLGIAVVTLYGRLYKSNLPVEIALKPGKLSTKHRQSKIKVINTETLEEEIFKNFSSARKVYKGLKKKHSEGSLLHDKIKFEII